MQAVSNTSPILNLALIGRLQLLQEQFRKRAPYQEQESEELGDDVIARFNPDTGEVENIEVLFFSTRLLRSDIFEIPFTMRETETRVTEAR